MNSRPLFLGLCLAFFFVATGCDDGRQRIVSTHTGDVDYIPVGQTPPEGWAAVCDPSACGAAPDLPTVECESGMLAGFTGDCIRVSTTDGGAERCAWQILDCTPPPASDGTPSPTFHACDPYACGRAPDGMPTCYDGTDAAVVCAPGLAGACAWQFLCGDAP